MTEKRFTIFGEWHKDYIIDEIRDNTGEYVTIGRVVDLLNENEELKKELFESEKDCLLETYNDNPVRRDEKIESLKEEFKERFRRDFK